MKRFKNILYFADGERSRTGAFERALRVARVNDARLTLVDVVVEDDLSDELLQRIGLGSEHPERLSRTDALEALRSVCRQAGIDAQLSVLSGKPFVEVIRAVLRDGHDLVIKPAQGHRGISARLFGSTDLHLLRKCPTPVLIDRAEAPPSSQPRVAADAGRGSDAYGTILAAVDPSQRGTAMLNRLIMDLATSLAEREGAVAHVVHAWRLPFESSLREGRTPLNYSELEEARSYLRNRHLEGLSGLLADYGIDPESSRVHLHNGVAAEVIADCAAEIGADLIVMGTLAHAGLPGLFIGSTAEDVIQSAQTPVMAVKPEQFVSPIRIG